jgi:hypothetical protein
MINSGYYIVDKSIKYMNARNPLEEGLFYDGDKNWSRNPNHAKVYGTAELAIEKARDLQKEGPVKVLYIEINGTNVGVGEIQF